MTQQVLINKSTGLAEALDPDAAQNGLSSGAYEVPLTDQQGNIVSAGYNDAQSLVAQGTHAQPNPDQINNLLKYAQHSSPREQALTALEAASETNTLGLSTKLEIASGMATPEDINARRQVNPGMHMAGQLAGLGLGALSGVGEAGLLSAAGKGAEALITGGEAAQGLGTAAKIAGAGARLSTEGALFQAGDEASKMFEQDPNQTMQSAASEVGLAALTAPFIGAGVEGANKAWNTMIGDKLGTFMDAAKQKLAIGNGTELPVSKELQDAYPQVKAVVSDFPGAEEFHQANLNASGSQGDKYRAGIQEFKDNASKEALNEMGYVPEDIGGPKSVSDAESGEALVKAISDDVQARYEPFKEQYEAKKNFYKGVDLTPTNKTDLGAKIANIAEEYKISPSSPEMGVLNRITDEMPNWDNINDLMKYRSIINDNLSNNGMWKLRRQVVDAFDSSVDSAVTDALGNAEGAKALDNFKALRSAYSDFRGHLEDLNDRLHVGNFEGPGGFIHKLNDMIPERVLGRMNPQKDAGLLDVLNRVPGASDIVKEYQMNKLVQNAARNAKGEFNLKNFVKSMDQQAPEMRDFLIDKDAYQRVRNINDMVNKLPTTDNPSGTARAWWRRFSDIPWGLGAGELLSHGSKILGGLYGVGAQMFVKEVPSAVRTAWLRFLGKDLPTNPLAFKAVVETADRAFAGAKTIKDGLKTVLTGNREYAIQKMTENEQKKLEDAAEAFRNDPAKMINMNGHLGEYEPDHANANTQMMTRAMQMINMMRPVNVPGSVLDRQVPVNKMQKANYQRGLQIINKPTTILQHIGNGTLTNNDLQIMKTVYPDLHQGMVNQAMSQLIDMKSKGQSVPYKQRMALSMFLGQPLDSTMKPSAILSNQPAAAAPPQQPQGTPFRSAKALGKLSQAYQTPGQAAEARRAMR